jgi:2-dehydro-3-deoxygluconokinase
MKKGYRSLSEDVNVTVACFGEVLVVLVQTEPGPLEAASSFGRSLGGAELNVSLALAANGVASAMISRVGDDGFGRYLSGSLAGRGIDVSAIEIDAVRPTGMYLTEIGGTSGQPSDLGPLRSRMHYFRTGSAASALSPEMLVTPHVTQVLDRASLVHTTGITPALSDSAHAAQSMLFAGRRPDQLISFDLKWRPALWAGRADDPDEALGTFVSGADVALLSSNEAKAVFGVAEPDELRRLFPEPRWLVVTNDDSSAVGFDGTRHFEVAPVDVDVVELIGAGDAFAAGLIGGLSENRQLAESMTRAHEWASRALRSRGDHAGAME